jgi:tetratricopeptide (TPR) repeat protein
MRKAVLFLLLSISNACFSQSVEELIAEGNMLEKQMKETEAYYKFKEVLKLKPGNIFALVRCSELAGRIGRLQNSKEKQLDYYKASKLYAERALRINEDDSEANLVMAIATGRLAMLKRGREKVEDVRDVKKYAERAIQLNPENFKALHILGKWNVEVSSLSALERELAKILFGGLPKASYEVALKYFLKAEALKPDFILNYFEMAKLYLKINKKPKALELLKHLLILPISASDDEMIKGEAKQLLMKIST